MPPRPIARKKTKAVAKARSNAGPRRSRSRPSAASAPRASVRKQNTNRQAAMMSVSYEEDEEG